MNKLTIIFGLLLGLLLMACGRSSDYGPIDSAPGMAGIIRDYQIASNRVESTPVIWNGTILNIISHREGSKAISIELIDDQGVSLGTIPTDMGFISAFVDQRTLFVYGVTDWTKQNQIQMISTVDLVNWADPIFIKGAVAGQTIFNTSITKDDTGYMMVYEVCEKGTSCFSERFAHSIDLIHWLDVGVKMHPDSYSACPTIRFFNRYYYITYLKMTADNFYATYVTRTNDLVKFDDSSLPLITTADRLSEGRNASDVDFVELAGVTYINYADGFQTGEWSNLMRAHYNGSLQQLLESFFL